MKITVPNRLLLAAMRDQRARLAALREGALKVLDDHKADAQRPCAGGGCHVERQLLGFVRQVEMKERVLDFEARRVAAKLWPWSRLPLDAWLSLIGDAGLEGVVITPASVDPADARGALAGLN